MSKKKKILISIIIIFILLVIGIWICLPEIIDSMFKAQYNSNGVSHFLVITVDKEQPKEYVGRLENHNIYIENLIKEETVFRSIDAKNVTFEEAFTNNLVSIEEWREYASKVESREDYEILQFQEYEIVVSKEECIIRPIYK